MRRIGKLHLLKLYLPTAPNAGWSWLLKRGRGREGREGIGGERDGGKRGRRGKRGRERKILILFYVYMHLWHAHMCTDVHRGQKRVSELLELELQKL